MHSECARMVQIFFVLESDVGDGWTSNKMPATTDVAWRYLHKYLIVGMQQSYRLTRD